MSDVCPRLADRERKQARLVDLIRRGGIFQKGCVEDIDQMPGVLDPLIAAGTADATVWYGGSGGRVRQLPRRDTTHRRRGCTPRRARFPAILSDHVEGVLDIIDATVAVGVALESAARRSPRHVAAAIAFPEEE